MIETRKPIFIKEIHLNDYRTYRNLSIKFTQNIHTLVGPNECGKTNLLFTFDLFKNPNLLQKSDVCCFVDEIFDTEAEIIFKMDLNNFSQFSNQEVHDLIIKYHGNDRTISIPSKEIKIAKKVYLISITSQPLPSGQIHITLSELVTLMELPANHHLDPIKEYDFIVNSPTLLKKIENYISTHQNKDYIKLKIEEETREVVNEVKIDTIIKAIKFVNWTFKEEYYIPDVIPLSNLQNQPKNYQSINNFFKIANIRIENFLSTSDHNLRNNILRRVNKEVSQVLNESWTQYQDVEIDITLGTDNALHIGFLENGHSIDPKRRSLGFQWFFAFLLYFNANFGNELKNCVILLDEPGIYLHPGGQKDLLKEIEKLSINNQIIYTTHLPFMINRNHPERIIFLNKKKGITYLKEPRKEGVFDDVLLANTLGFNFSSLSNFGEVNLLLEGITDKILIETLVIKYSQNKKEDILDLNYISLIQINGLSNLDSFIRVTQETSINFLVLLDDDEIGKAIYNKYQKNADKYQNAIEYFFKLKNGKEIEDLIPFNIVFNAFENVKKNIDPWNIMINDDLKLRQSKITPQIKDIINIIKEDQSLKDNEEFNQIITSGQLKLDLMLEVKNLITEENCLEFNELIEILGQINTKGFEIIRKIRSSDD